MHIIPELAPSLVMTLPFIVAFLGLWLILWKPLMDFLEERDQATEGARHEAEEFAAQAESRAGELENRLAAAHLEIVDLHATHRATALAKEAEIVAAARAKADAHVKDAQERIQGEKASAKAELETTARVLSTDIVNQLLA